ncbi:sensor histidine kinase [Methanolobus mangrovi]|uniref:Sensor histidine kinase n=1 Tax=Methanolobus mangrovi TaxID=3072977 RepID=A0AA51UDG4_9EURY|nr:sensor histidine kinase [Methanolobus mangrovi]WMW21162.1 sensor histidine kinase [Methanolobus mangrovi]
MNCESNVYKIGVLSVNGEKDNTMEQWTPTAEYLSTSIPNTTFEVIPLDYDEFFFVIDNEGIDFFYSNPMVYVEMARIYGAGRIATFQPMWENSSYDGFGGVILTRADRDDINSLQDLKDKSFMAVSEESFGGFLAGAGELHHNGINYNTDFNELTFGKTHDKVVLSIINGDVDAGTVRTGTLEKMALEGKINLKDIKVLNQKEYENFPLLVSTDIYPEWMFGKTALTSDDISNKVSIALLSMPSNSNAAITLDSSGWSVPASYSPVDNLMKELRVSLYVDYGKVSPTQAIIQYWYVLALIFMLFIIFEVHSRWMLEKAKKSKLEDSNELKDLFADIMRHDLLNPAGIVKGFSDVLYMKEMDVEKKETLKIISEQTDHLISMISSAAKLSKLESYEEMKFETNDVGIILWDVVGSFSPEFRKKDIKLDFELKGEYPSRINDIIEDVFSNLISNALKYSPSGSTIRVEIAEIGKSWKIMVADEGDGIPDEAKPYIFERFKRADKKGIKGSGLGLAIVKRIVDIHNGTVGVEDNPQGKGSVFWVMLDKA